MKREAFPETDRNTQQKSGSQPQRQSERAQTPSARIEREVLPKTDRNTQQKVPTRRASNRPGKIPFNEPQPNKVRQAQPQRVALPDFLASKKPEEPSKPATSGWGSGPTARKSLEYGEDVARNPAEEPLSESSTADTDVFAEPSVEQQSRDSLSGIAELQKQEATSVAQSRDSLSRISDNNLQKQEAAHVAPGGDSSSGISDSKIQKQEAPPARRGGFGLKPNSGSQSIYDILNIASSTPANQSAEEPSTAENAGAARESRSLPAQGDSRYHATPFDAEAYQQDLINDHSEPQDNWQHLRPKQPEPARSAPEPTVRYHATPPDDDEWIDRRFAEYQQERDTQNQRRAQPVRQQPESTNVQNNTYTPFSAGPFESDTSKRKCGRCGQIGHVARDCTGPARMKCRICGEIGHVQRECPSNTQGQPASSRDGQQGFKVRAVGRSADSDYRPQARQERSSHDFRTQDPRQVMMEHMRSVEPVEEEGASEEPSERMLRSRKFRDLEEPEKKKPTRRGRKFDDDEDEDARPARRGRRDFDEDGEEDGYGRKSRKTGKKEAKEAQKKAERAAERAAQDAERAGQIRLPEFISVQNLAQALNVRYERFVQRLEDLGYDDIFAGKIFNTETSGMIAMEYDMEPIFETGVKEEEERDLKPRPEVDAQDKDFLPTRPPVVTIMGHVDHGKTTILDYLRKSSVAAGEAGGITQHIGAFSVPLASSGKTVTFLDTPGHAAFLAMRQRGANVTDIVILVVAGDDSVKPQTLEAIKHARAANVPMIVAVNKCDKEEADVQRVKQDLARHGVEIEDFGGETQVVQVSGKTGLGMDELEENVVTLSEILDHRADADGLVEGWVLEATTKKAGRVATVLVRRGTLRQGSVLVAGRTWARVRSLRNEAGVVVTEAGPGMPVEVDGWRDQPAAGDEVLQAPTEQKATAVVEYRAEKAEREKTAVDMEAINAARQLEQQKRDRERRAEQAKLRDPESTEPPEAKEESGTSSGRAEVPFLIKADVSGSAEAVSAYMMSVSSPMISPLILSSTVGAVHESDIELAATAGGHIISFNLPLDEKMRSLAESQGVRVLENNIIYRVLDDVKAVLEEKLPPIITQRVLGEAEVGAAFEIGVGGRKKVKIAGCKVRNGAIGKGSRARVMRGDEKVYDGLISSLKNVKKDVQEMRKGSECGMGFENWEGFEVGDQIQTYEERSQKRTL